MTNRGAVDAHIHQWDPFTTPRMVSGVAKVLRRAPFLAPVLMRVFPRASRDFVGDPTHLLNRYLPADYVADAAGADVDTVVHIEVDWHSKDPLGSADETHWVSALPFGRDGAPELGAIVVHAEPAHPRIAEVLDAHLAAGPLVRGVRCIGARHDDPGVMGWPESPHLYAEPDFLRGFAALAERNLSFDMWVYSHQLSDAVTLAREYPDTTFVLDHYGTPVGAFGPRGRDTGRTPAQRADILARWRDDVAALAQLPNVVAKHSGLAMPVLGAGPVAREQLRDLAAPLITHLQAVFGADRTFWASNYPIDKPNGALPDSIWILREVLGDAFDDDAMLRDNARRTYRMPVG